ncbi:MAG: UbiD family decarboxylase [Nitrososphaerota archaeon]|nr:UbiD family decarboxylase [Nitrososphaerota archaeon]
MTSDLRNFITQLEARDQVRHVKVEVDPEFEIGTIQREVFDLRGPALFFENVKGFTIPLITGVLDTWERYGLALGLEKEELRLPEPRIKEKLLRKLKETSQRQIAPKVVATGPCKENILKDESVNLHNFPSPRWHPKDGGKYIGTLGCMVAKDPETGIRNIGVYRGQVAGKNLVAIKATQQLGIIQQKYQRMNKPMPIAVAIGVPPKTMIASCISAPYGVDEYALAGGIANEPLDLVECETVDLEVPSHSEIVIEGEVPPSEEEWSEEGPFGELTGFYAGERARRPTIHVSAITHRTNPIFQGTLEGRPPSESATIRSVGASAGLWGRVEKVGIPGFSKLWCDEMGCGGSFVTYASLKSHFYFGNAQQLLMAIQTVSLVRSKVTVILDDDVDIFDRGQVIWAISTNVAPHRDVVVSPNNQVGHDLDPSVDPSDRLYPRTRYSRVGIDATRFNKGFDFPEMASPLEDQYELVRKRWKDYGIS